jgi:hypothetical protein
MRKKDKESQGMASHQFHQHAVRPMNERGMGKKHHGAIAFDDGGTLQAAEFHNVLVVGFVLHTFVNPNIPNFGLVAIVNHLVSYLGLACHHERGLHGWSYIGDASKTLAPVDVFGLRIHRDGVVSFVQKFVKQQSGEMLGIARDTHKGDSLAFQEFGNIFQ